MTEREALLLDELHHKFLARLFLVVAAWTPDRVAIPSECEWVGINLLWRDGEINKDGRVSRPLDLA